MRKLLICSFLVFCGHTIICQTAPSLQFVKSVRQKGPVAYRDPFGSISPDGKMFAYSDRKQIIVQQIVGGATFELEKHGRFVITLAWHPDSKRILTYEIGGPKDYWYVYDLESKTGKVWWPEKKSFKDGKAKLEIERSELKDLTWSADATLLAGLSKRNGKTQLWLMDSIGQHERVAVEKNLIESIQWNPATKSFAGIVEVDGKRFIQFNLLDERSQKLVANSYGPIAFSPDGKYLYFSIANDKKVVDLQQYDISNGKQSQLASFSRDSYGPSVAKDGSVLFRLQDYRVFIAAVDGEGGESKPITTFKMNQETGEAVRPQIELVPPGLEDGIYTDAQWLDNSHLVIEYVVDPETKEIHIIPIDGSPGKKIHSFKSDQLYSGIGISHDQRWVAFIAPDNNGTFQVFKVSIDGKEVKQLTFDNTDKAHPSGSPTDNIFSFTVFNFQSIFWMIRP